jgi:hypothetical protein
MLNKGRIYGIFDNFNKKIVYVGKTINLLDYTPHGRHIKKLFSKYPQRYTYKILEENIDQKNLDKIEKDYIKKYNTYNDVDCFNYTVGGGGGDTFSKLTKYKKIKAIKKRIASNKIVKGTKEFKVKMKPIWKNIGEKNRQNLTGRKLTEQHKKRISNGIQKALKDVTLRNKISHKGQKKPPRSTQHKKNISIAMKGKKKSKEHKLKIKEKQKGRKKITNGVQRSWLFLGQDLPLGWRYLVS